MSIRHPLLPLVLLSIGCEHDEISKSDDTSSALDTAEEVTEGCVVPDDQSSIFGTIELRPTTIPTVFTVHWGPQLEGASWVGFGPREADERVAPPRSAPGDRAEALLVGLQHSRSYRYRIFLDDGDTLYCSAERSLTTGAIDPQLPSPSLQVSAPELASGDFVVTVIDNPVGSTGRWAVIIDAEGQIVWAQRADAIRVWLSLDRQALLVNDHTYHPESPGSILRLPLDGSEPEEIVIEGAHTDFVEVEPGVYATFGWDLRSVEDGTRILAGETIVEQEAGGEPRRVWSTFDALEPDPNDDFGAEASWPEGVEYWVHLNHLHYDRQQNAYLSAGRNTENIFAVDRASGGTTWILERGGGDFEPTGDIEFNPHSAVPSPDGLLLFDTGSSSTDNCSAASEFALDTSLMTVGHLREYHTEDCLVTGYLGNAVLQESGNRSLVLAMNGQIDEVTAAGALTWRLNLPASWTFGYATREASLYP
jgi:hypothetical protein